MNFIAIDIVIPKNGKIEHSLHSIPNTKDFRF